MPDSSEPSADLTSLMAGFAAGDRAAAEALLPQVFLELRQIAEAHLKRQQPGHTLQPTALVNEAYLKLVQSSQLEVRDRKHFYILAARVMRQILVDHARGKAAQKRGGGMQRITFADLDAGGGPDLDVLALHEALNKLTTMAPDRAKLVELRFFAGLTLEETAGVLDISRAEVVRRWRAVRAWLSLELKDALHDA